jgi:hypothetical protein
VIVGMRTCQQAARVAAVTGGVQLAGRPDKNGTPRLSRLVDVGADVEAHRGMHASDIDWGKQLIQVRRKGSLAAQWLQGSAEAFVWLRLHVDEIANRNRRTISCSRPCAAAETALTRNYDHAKASKR